jgi:8-oxo-dGTP diphosphatase
MDPIIVTCAIITIDDKILAVQRSRLMSLPMKWEFPGGKLEPAETEMECIKREIREELNIEIEMLDRLLPSVYRYPTFTIELIPYTANYVSGELKLKEHNNYVLLNKDELNTLDWAEADLPIVHEVMKL